MKLTRTIVFFFSITGLMPPLSATADIRVEIFPIGGGTATVQTFPPGSDVSLTLDNNDDFVRVRTIPSGQDVGEITIQGSGDSKIELFLGSVTPGTGPLSTPGARNWDGLTSFRDNIELKAFITGDLTGSVGADRIVRMDVEGTIRAGISQTTSPNLGGGAFFISASAIQPGVSIRADHGNIGLVQTTGFSILGADIRAIQGLINNVEALSGDIGTPAAPMSLAARDGINRISGGNIYANIDPDDNPASPDSGSLGQLLVGFDFDGTIGLESFNEIRIGRDLLGQVSLGAQLSGAQVFNIGRSFGTVSNPAKIVFEDFDAMAGTGGIAGQVSINDSDLGGVWAAGSTVENQSGAIVLTGPAYTQTAASIGGGAVGLVPFDLHEESSDPVGGSSVPPDATVDFKAYDQPAVVRHYGPTTFSVTPPVVVERRRIGTSGAWIDVSSGLAYSLADAGRELVLTPPTSPGSDFRFYKGFDYRVAPTADLLCDVAASPKPPVAAYTYEFSVPDACQGDLDGDGAIGSADLALLLGVWGPCPAGTNPCLADIDGNGEVGSSDLALLLGRWGAACFGESAGSGGMQAMQQQAGTPAPPIIASFGFETVEEYTAWLETLTQKELDEHIVELLEIALGG